MDAKSLSVSQLNDYIKGVFEDELILHDISLFGEIFQYRIAGKNIYLTLREGNSYLECMHFGTLENFTVGAKVKLYGSVNYFTKGGKVSFIFKSIALTGDGELYAEFLKLKTKLKNEGLFENKLPMPTFIKNIAIITSETGAVIHDFISTVYRYNNIGKIDIFPSRVQGVEAATEIKTTIALICKTKKYDVIVIARGGGAESDLEVFNTEIVARSVSNSIIPIISAVGHETDFTLCDFCSSFRAGTPSIAGETIANINNLKITEFIFAREQLSKNLDNIMLHNERRLKNAITVVMQNANMKIALSEQSLKHNIDSLSSNLLDILENKHSKIKDNVNKFILLTENLIASNEQKLTFFENALDKNSPSRIFSKGYAKILLNNKQLTSVKDITIDDNINIYIADGNFCAAVKNKHEY